MESMYFLIPISFLFVVIAIGFYIWAVRGGQYDDLDTEGQRILFDDTQAPTLTPASPPGTGDHGNSHQPGPPNTSPDPQGDARP